MNIKSYKVTTLINITRKEVIFQIFCEGRSDDKTDLGNYRPVLIIFAIANVFGKLVYDQFYTYLTSNHLINSYQSGFRS